MLSRSVIGIQRSVKGVGIGGIYKNRKNTSSDLFRLENPKNVLIEKPSLVGQYYPLLQKRNYDQPPTSDATGHFVYKGIAKCLNTADAVAASKDFLLVKRTVKSVNVWCKMAFEKYFLQHWWVRHTIKEFNRKLANARRERAIKQIVK